MKKRIVSITVLALAAAGLLTYVILYYLESTTSISSKEMSQADFLKDKHALLYFSTTIDTTPGKSYAVFLNKNGNVSARKMLPLELGTTAIHDSQAVMSDKDHIYLAGENAKTITRPPQHTGYDGGAGFIKDTNSFYTIYNSGYSKDMKNYRSEVYWGIGSKLNQDVIPYFIAANGTFHDNIYTAQTPDDSSSSETRKFVFHKVVLKEDMEIHPVMEVTLGKNASPLSPLLIDDQFIYFIINGPKGEHVYQLVKINLQTKDAETIDIKRYQKDPQTVYKAIPYSNNSTYMDSNNIYFADGLGKVMIINKSTGKKQREFQLNPNLVKLGIKKIFFKNQFLYLFAMNYGGDGQIEKYDLQNGQVTDTIKVKGIGKIISANSHVHLYDFKMIK
ncbi:hypothetical protein LRR81_07845 [Metabacillus sp. GX 13764]|uniref:hypothetical protein n=1 Tax=Metabacillus kandeliae TaxID=2900151 RepID=UPI001E2FACFF|nr:hypothetical protein [Metabacillus kandeliae]MCD7034143.1 hypothetical protein [Metabacillus kandeliae]